MDFLSVTEDLEKKWLEENDSKKKEKLGKKVEWKKAVVISCAKDIGKAGGNLQSIWNNMTERQRQLIQELFPYGLESDSLAQQEKRMQIINSYKRNILKVLEAEKKYPPCDPNLPVKEKVKNRCYKAEAALGRDLYTSSQKESKSYCADWNYEEHFATTVEFTGEERQVLARCYELGREYDDYCMNEKYAVIINIGDALINTAHNREEQNKLSVARRWIKSTYTSIFPSLIRQMNPGRKYTAAEMEWEAKEMTKRFIQFIGNRERRDQLMQEWNRLMNDPSIRGYKEHERAAMVLRTVTPQIGEEAAWFTYSCTSIPESAYGMELVLEYSYEELGLE